MTQQIVFYTDGSLKSPPKKKGWGMMGVGIVGLCGFHEKEWSIPLGPGTCQLAEILAVREALKALGDRPGTDVTIYSDSSYAIGVLYEGTQVKANREAVEETKTLTRECATFRMVHVKGHSGDRLNERAHALAGAAAESQDLADLPPAPGKPPTVTDQLRGIADQIAGAGTITVHTDVFKEAARQADNRDAQIDHLQDLVGRLVPALRFYADPVNWQRREETCQPVPAVVLDKGYVARQTLLKNGIAIADDPYEDPASISKRGSDG